MSLQRWCTPLAIVLLCGLASKPVLAAEAEDVLRGVLSNAGDKVISSGEFTFDLRDQSKNLFATEAVEHEDEMVRRQKLYYTDYKSRYYYAIRGPVLGGDIYFEQELLDHPYGKIKEYYLTRNYGANKQSHFNFTDMMGQALIDGRPDTQPVVSLFGRVCGVVTSLDSSSFSDLQVKTTREEVLGASVTQLTAVLNDVGALGVTKVVIKTVPELGYVTPSVQEFDMSGDLIRSWEAMNFFKPKASDLLFPADVVYKFAFGDEARTQTYSFRRASVQLNHRIPKQRFAIELPAKTIIVDNSAGENINYKVKETAWLGTDDLAELSTNAMLVNLSDLSVPQLPGLRRHHVVWYIAAAVICVGLLLLFLRKDKFGARTGMFFLVLMSATGCRPADASSRLIVVPEIVDLGEIASEQRVRRFSFSVENVTDDPQAVKVHPNCSCLLLGDLAVSIPAKESHTFNCELNLSGRIGDFTAKILVEACDGHQIVPISTTIVEKWTVVPRRVVVAAGEVASVSISAPVSDWEGIGVQSFGDGILYRIESSEEREGYLTKFFVIDVPNADNIASNRGLLFKNVDAEDFLAVPVVLAD